MMLLFDIDGTLVRTGGAGNRSLDRAFLACHGIPHAMEGIQPAGKTDPAIIREIFHAKLGRNCSSEELSQICGKYLEILPEEIRTAPHYRLMPGIAEILEKTAVMDTCIVGLVTGNLQRGARIKLERADINRFFRFGGYGSDSESRPELTRIGIENGRRLQKHPSANKDIYLIGDTPFDIDAGKKAGVFTVAVATGPYKTVDLESHHPDFVFENFSNTTAFFRAVGLGR